LQELFNIEFFSKNLSLRKQQLLKIVVLVKHHTMLPTPFTVLRLGMTELFLLHENKFSSICIELSKSWPKSGKEKIYRLHNSFVYVFFFLLPA
jgi:hypothetical protein